MHTTPFHNRLKLSHNPVRFLLFHYMGCCGMDRGEPAQLALPDS